MESMQQQDTNEKISKAIHLLEEITAEESQNISQRIRQQFKERTEDVDKRVHESPWRYMAVAAATGAAIGFYFGYRRS